MQIIVRDNSPDLSNLDLVQPVEDGVVRAEVDDHRYKEWAEFIRSNNSKFSAGPYRTMWGHGSARDATEAQSFAIGQLTYLETKAIQRLYTPRRYETVLGGCISSEAGPWAKSINYKVKDQVGIGKRITPSSSTLPRANTAYALVNVPVEMGGIQYEYTVEDLVTSSFLGQPLPEDEQGAAIEAYKRHINQMALLGELNFQGFYKNSGVTAANRTSGAVWDSATADSIIADVIAAVGAYNAGTADNAEPRLMIVPVTTMQILKKPRATASDMSIQNYLEKTLNLTIISDFALEAAGVGPSKRVVLCNPDLDNTILHIPRSIEFLAPQMEGLMIRVPSSYKYAGTEIRRVLWVRYMDGV